MTRRRFTLLAVAVVALNLFLWLAPAGLAVRNALISQFFGPRMVRAEVVVLDPSGTPQDYRIDRGIVVGSAAAAGANPATITLNEADGTTETIPIAATTRVVGRPRFSNLLRLPKNVRVLVVRPANGPAQMVEVEGRGR